MERHGVEMMVCRQLCDPVHAPSGEGTGDGTPMRTIPLVEEMQVTERFRAFAALPMQDPEMAAVRVGALS